MIVLWLFILTILAMFLIAVATVMYLAIPIGVALIFVYVIKALKDNKNKQG